MSTQFTPTPAELALVSQIFAQGDPQKLGILTGEVAVRLFGGAKLPPTVLGEIWSIADEENNGWLPKKGVTIAVRLMGWAQKGEKVTPALVNKSGPLPNIEGITPVAQHNTGVSSPPPGLPPFTVQDRNKFQTLFSKSGPTNGLLSGEKARDFFVKSGLGNDKLLQIWNLADTQDRGALDSTDFAIGMYFIQGLMSGQLSFIPSSLPSGLYQQAGGNPSSTQGSVRSHLSGNSGSFSPLSGAFPQNRGNIQPQYTGQSQVLQPDYTGLGATQSKPPALPVRPSSSPYNPSPFVPQRNGHAPQWDVTPTEKANADRFFDDLDPQRRGYIEGDVAVPFMLKSNLPGEDLAQVWDLADISNDGRLTRDGFAVAMHLISKKMGGTDIPTTLPPSLVPPSMRVNGASPFSPVVQQVPEPLNDLLWDDTPLPSAVASHQTGPTSSVFASMSTSIAENHDPFSSATSAKSHRDLLGDDDDVGHTSTHLHDQSAEIGNVQNQLNSTNRSLDAAKQERTTIEQTLANQASQLSALQTQLSSAKAAYETETKLLATLKERHAGQVAEIQKSREELIRAESDLSAVRVEKSEVEGTFLRDKEEARELHRKMVEAGQQAEALKLEIEKAKKDAKQQKGLLAIARKQLSTKEFEKTKAEKDLDQVNAEVSSITKEREEAESELSEPSRPTSLSEVPRDLSGDSLAFAASQTLPVSPDASSPAGSTLGKSNNPFEKMAKVPDQSPPDTPGAFLPFGGSLIPASSVPINDTVVSNTNAFDPFGFSRAFETDETTQTPIQPPSPTIPGSRTSTPKPTDLNTTNPLSPASPEGSEEYTTPPTTADISTPQAATQASTDSANTTVPSIANAASHFPDIDADTDIFNHSPAITTKETPGETDLSASLKDLEVDHESDSDSDDEVPLADLAKVKNSSSDSPIAPVQSGVPTTSFDDIFGVTQPATNPPSIPENDVPGAAKASTLVPPTDAFVPVGNVVPPTEALAVAGVNAFDEAMGKIPSAAPPSTQHFTFDSSFDDNFDFSSATATQLSPAPAIVPNGKTKESFDSTFMDTSTKDTPLNEAAPLPSSALTNDPQAKVAKPTFEEAFSGFDSGPSLSLQAFPPPTAQGLTPNTGATDSSVQAIFPVSEAPTPKPEPASPRSTPASPRARSPPLRMTSPKPRLSSSSSKEVPEKPKEPTTRHSKLSIRLPFGKKKKQQQQQQSEPLPAQLPHFLNPPLEETRPISPATDDDVEAVKQLTAMGFSRTQSVNALEKYGYDVQKALNSLLGAP